MIGQKYNRQIKAAIYPELSQEEKRIHAGFK